MKSKFIKKYGKVFDWIAVVLLLVGGLSLGLLAFNFNLVTFIFTTGIVSKAIYFLVGASAVWIIIRSLMKRFMK